MMEDCAETTKSSPQEMMNAVCSNCKKPRGKHAAAGHWCPNPKLGVRFSNTTKFAWNGKAPKEAKFTI